MYLVALDSGHILCYVIAERLAILHNDVAALNVMKENIGKLLLLLRQHGKTSVKLILRISQIIHRAVTMKQPQILVKTRVHIVRVNFLRVYRRDMSVDVIRHVSTTAAVPAGEKLPIPSNKDAVNIFIQQKGYLLVRLLRELVLKALPYFIQIQRVYPLGIEARQHLIDDNQQAYLGISKNLFCPIWYKITA